MKAITLTQPWATLIAIGAKKIETRSWGTSYRGPLAIHAAKGLGPGGINAYLERCTASEPIYAALNDAGLVPFTWDADALLALPRGAIVAVCTLADCRPTDEREAQYKGGWFKSMSATTTRFWELTDQERAFGNYTPRRLAWLLADVRALPEPIPARGALGLWEYEEQGLHIRLQPTTKG